MENITEKEREKQRISVSIVIPFLFISALWLVYFAEIASGLDFSFLGIYPRHVSGLKGILFTPFLHGSLGHLVSNTIPLLVLGGGMIYFYRNIAYYVFLWIWLLDGVGVWLLGREAYHIGASGLVYGMASFLIFSGILRKNRNLLALALAVVFVYGGLIWGMFPYLTDISWEAHLFGFMTGVYFSVHYLRKGPPDDPVPDWMKEEEDTVDQDGENDTEGRIIIHYSHKSKDEDKEDSD